MAVSDQADSVSGFQDLVASAQSDSKVLSLVIPFHVSKISNKMSTSMFSQPAYTWFHTLGPGGCVAGSLVRRRSAVVLDADGALSVCAARDDARAPPPFFFSHAEFIWLAPELGDIALLGAARGPRLR